MSARNYFVADSLLSDVTYLIRASGELDLAARDELTDSLRRAQLSTAETLRLDFIDVTFIDSTAIKTLAVAGRNILHGGGRVELLVGDENVYRIFEITGLDRYFDLSVQPRLPELVR